MDAIALTPNSLTWRDTNKFRVNVIWDAAYCLVYKLEIDRRFVPDYDRDFLKTIEPFAKFLHQHLTLCKHCSSYVDNYQNYSEWFNSIVEEQYLHDLDEQKLYMNISKQQCLTERKTIVKKLKNGQNPVDKNEFPHLWQLMETCVSLYRSQYNFKDDYWEPFLNAFRDWNKVFASPAWAALVLKSEKLHIRPSKGGHLLPLLPSEKYVSNLRKREVNLMVSVRIISNSLAV